MTKLDDVYAAITARYEAWERGETTSPSTLDFVYDAERLLGVDLTFEERGAVADYLYDASAGGADARTLAVLAASIVNPTWVERRVAQSAAGGHT